MHNEILEKTKKEAWFKFRNLFPFLRGFEEPSISFNNRLTSTAGRCFYELNKIDISFKLYQIDSKEILEQTVPHELAHQASWNIYKAPGHGAEWKRIMNAFGLEATRCHSIGNEKIPEDTFAIMAKASEFSVGSKVSFEHRDRSRKVTIHTGFVIKVNLKTIKVDVYGGIWTVPIDTKSLRRV